LIDHILLRRNTIAINAIFKPKIRLRKMLEVLGKSEGKYDQGLHSKS
jgi:hypothetical protein